MGEALIIGFPRTMEGDEAAHGQGSCASAIRSGLLALDGVFHRKCYLEYYDRVCELIFKEGRPCVTVTGTAGIGISTFHSAFYEKLRKEHPKACVIAAYFQKEKLVRAIVSINGEEQLVRERTPSETQDRIDLITDEARKAGQKAFFLCDGSPDFPRQYRRTVVFSSPNKNWLRVEAKLQSTIYLPPWTCKELQEAAHALGYPLDDDEIEKRFEMFGGVARYCLSPKQPAVDRAARRIVQVVQGITKPMDIRALIMAWDDDSTRQRVFHYVPYGDSSAMMAKFASSFIESKCSAVMQQASREDQLMLRQTIEDMDEQLLRQWIWQVEAHERLREGCELQLHALQLDMGMPAVESITIEPTETSEGFNIDSLSLVEATRGPYHPLKSNTMESINAFYLSSMPEHADGQDIVAWWESNPDSRLVLFQMTVSKSSNVNAFGIIHVLDKLGLLESVAKEPWRVALVFVVPGERIGNFERQTIAGIDASTPQSVKDIIGIGASTADTLAAYDITTIAQLEAAMAMNGSMFRDRDRSAWNRPVKCWKKHGNAIRYTAYINAVAKIPQYACV